MYLVFGMAADAMVAAIPFSGREKNPRHLKDWGLDGADGAAVVAPSNERASSPRSATADVEARSPSRVWQTEPTAMLRGLD